MADSILRDSQNSSSTNLRQYLSAPRRQLENLKSERCRRHLRTFIKTAWPIVEPAAFVPGWHIDAIAEHLEAVSQGLIRRLLITIPPRHMKSLAVGVFWPAWEWIEHPELRWLCASYAESLSIRDNVRTRRLIQSAWYQANWGDRYQLMADQSEKRRFETDRGGFRIAVGAAGAATGEGGDRIVCDDPHNVAEVESDAVRKGVLDWWDTVMSTRLNNPQTSAQVIVMQRLHQDDLAGHVLEQGGWEHLALPAEYEGDTRATSIGWRDPRTTPGELLWPARYGRPEIDALKRSLGSYAAAGQLQQQPSPAGGGVFKRWWWRYWQPKGMNLAPVTVRLADGRTQQVNPVDLPDDFDEQLQSWDCAFKDLSTSDYVAGGVWARRGAYRFLLDQRRERLSFPRTLDAIETMSEKWPMTYTKLVEDKANGTAVIATLQQKISGLVPVNPAGGKIVRAQAVSPGIESGNVFLPHPAIAPWVDSFIDECSAFPNGRHDDQVDQCTQALNRLQNRAPYGWLDYMMDAKRDLDQQQEARMAATAQRLSSIGVPVPQAIAVPVDTPRRPGVVCPECDGVCILPVSTGGLKCGACGYQWDGPNLRPTSPPTRSKASKDTLYRW
jgi:predicted phage terminase large subunit-like protein